LFDWRTELSPSRTYMKLDSSDGPSAGWVRADLVQAAGPVAYLQVDDLAGTLDAVEKSGGRVLVRSLPFAGGGEIGLFADPDGNVIGLWHRKGGNGGGAAAKTVAKAPAAKPAGAPKPAAKPKKK
jgi:predicted enzyme related to lactoylglutathione lyase